MASWDTLNGFLDWMATNGAVDPRQLRPEDLRETPELPRRWPVLPPLPPRQEFTNPSPRPGSVTAPVEQTLADQIAGPALGAYEGGKTAYEGYQAGDPRKMVGGGAMTAMSLLPWARRVPKFERIMREEELAGPKGPSTSHVGMLPWGMASAGGAGGAYLGHQFDDENSHAGTLLGGLMGMVGGGAAGMLPVWQQQRLWEEAQRRENAVRRNFGPAPVAPPPAQPPASPPRASLTERMQQGRQAVPQTPQAPGFNPDDFAGPTGARGAPSRILGGVRITQGADGRWRDPAGRFVEPPSGPYLGEGFDALLRELERTSRRR
jgi:hypothetical protein